MILDVGIGTPEGQNGGGSAHGGAGGDGHAASPTPSGYLGSTNVYGSISRPIFFGSSIKQSKGGGAVRIVASVSVVVESSGSISVNGGGRKNIANHQGSASGGSILIETPLLEVGGVIAANGGDTSTTGYSGGGGGGRIGIHTKSLSWLGNSSQSRSSAMLLANGGRKICTSGCYPGFPGTIYINASMLEDLVVSDGVTLNGLVPVAEDVAWKSLNVHGILELGITPSLTSGCTLIIVHQ